MCSRLRGFAGSLSMGVSWSELDESLNSRLDDANVLRFLSGAGKQEALPKTASVILLVSF